MCNRAGSDTTADFTWHAELAKFVPLFSAQTHLHTRLGASSDAAARFSYRRWSFRVAYSPIPLGVFSSPAAAAASECAVKPCRSHRASQKISATSAGAHFSLLWIRSKVEDAITFLFFRFHCDLGFHFLSSSSSLLLLLLLLPLFFAVVASTLPTPTRRTHMS